MKAISLHIAFAALLSLLSLASCSRNDEVTVADGEEGKVYVTLTLSINGEEAGSRAAWDPEQTTDEQGVGWENEINNLQILIYNENNTYAGTVEGLFGSSDRYIGTLSGTNWQSGTYKFVVLANFTATNINLADLATLTYNQNAAYIPMYGVLKNNFTFAAGKNTDIGSIDLLRAMAKVEVEFSDDFPTDYTIGDITISPYNTKGHCVPNGYTSVETTGKLDREEAGTTYSFNPLASKSTSSLTFKEENGKYYIYLPEYDNSTDAAQIQVTVNGETYPLAFKNYENGVPTGEPYDIVRNHIYRYTITGVSDGMLTVKYHALPWEVVSSKINFGTSISCELKAENNDEEAKYGILHKPTYTNKKYKDGGDYSILKPGTAGALYRFDLQAPAGTVWTAHLSNEEDFYFSHSVYKNDKKLVSTGIARGESGKNLPFYIQINATNPWQAITKDGTNLKEGEIDFNTRSDWGKEVESEHRVVESYFYITVSADGIHETELEINPTDNNTDFKDNRRFPGTATRIWIRQVPAQKGRGANNTDETKIWPASELAKDINPTESDFQWWRVNPYWK